MSERMLIKSCPFCDNDDLEIEQVDDDGIYEIACNDCHMNWQITDTPDEAIRRWNTRPQEEKLNDALGNAIKIIDGLKHCINGIEKNVDIAFELMEELQSGE